MASEHLAQTKAALHALGPQAVQTLEKILRGDSNVTGFQAATARDILDRMGVPPLGGPQIVLAEKK